MIRYTQYMIKRHVGRTPAAILAAMIIVSLVGAAGDLHRELRQQCAGSWTHPTDAGS